MPAAGSDLYCLNLFEEVQKQGHLMNWLKLDLAKPILVTRIRVTTDAVNADFYVDNVFIGKQELRSMFPITYLLLLGIMVVQNLHKWQNEQTTVRTQRCFDVYTTSKTLKQRRINVKTTVVYVYWDNY